VRARYELQEIGQPDLTHVVNEFLKRVSAPCFACETCGKLMAIAGDNPMG